MVRGGAKPRAARPGDCGVRFNIRRMKAELLDWLARLDLQQYAPAFERESIEDLDALRRLQEHHLKELGLTMGHRMKLLEALWPASPTAARAPSPPASRGRVFLSYGHDPVCTALVDRVKADLREHGWDPWVDVERIKPDDDWRRTITQGLQESQHVLAFLSQHSMRRDGVCRQEVAIALGPAQCGVFTVLVEAPEKVRPPLIISHKQWLDMQAWQTLDTPGQEALYQSSFQEILRVLEKNEPFAGEIDALYRWLKPLDATAYMIAAESGFEGRAWLLDGFGLEGEPGAETAGEIERWRTASSPQRVYWLAAEPGWGKSAVSARLAHAGRARVMAVHFCRHEVPSSRDARQVVRTIAFQMASQLGEYRSLLTALARKGLALDAMNPVELFQELLANLLAGVIGGGRGPHDRHLIVLDALDETLDPAGRSDLLNLVASEFGKLPDWLGLLVTSRPEAPVVRQLGAFGVQQMQADDPRNRQDVERWTRTWLRSTALAEAEQARALNAVMHASAGNFLYVRMLQDAVRAGAVRIDQVLKPAGLPGGLSSLYERWFQHRFPDTARYAREQRPLLELLLAARAPLPAELAASVLGWDSYTRADPVGALGTLCVIDGGAIRLFHKSLRDWLADPHGSGPDYHASETEGHRRLADALWESCQAWKATGSWPARGLPHASDAGPEEAYALRHLPAHQKAAGRLAQRAQSLTDFALLMRRCAFDAIEELLADYHDGTDPDGPLAHWAQFLKEQGHLLRMARAHAWPAQKVLLPLALERPQDDPLRHAAQAWVSSAKPAWPWLVREQAPPARIHRTLDVSAQGILRAGLFDVDWEAARVGIAGDSGPLRVLDLNTGRILHEVPVPRGCRRIRLQHDQVQCWGEDGEPMVWSLVTASVVSADPGPQGFRVTQEGSTGRVPGRPARQTSRNGRFTLASDGHDSLRLIEAGVDTGPASQTLEGPPSLTTLAVSDDGALCAAGGSDGALWLWRPGAPQPLQCLQAGRHAAYGLAVASRSGHVAAIGEDRLLRVWDGHTGTLWAALAGHAYRATRVSLDPDGRRAVTAGQDGTLMVWDLTAPCIEAVRPEVGALAEASPGVLLAGDAFGQLHLHPLAAQAPAAPRRWQAHEARIWDLAVTPDHRHAATAGEDGRLRVWDLASGDCVADLRSVSGKALYAVALSPDGRWMVASGLDKQPLLWDLQAVLRSAGDHDAGMPQPQALECRVLLEKLLFLNTDEFAGAGLDGKVRGWRVGDPAARWEIDHHAAGEQGPRARLKGSRERGAYALAVSRSGRFLACSGRGVDRAITLWDLGEDRQAQSARCVNVLHGHARGVKFLAFRDDDRHLLSASWDETLVMWDWRRAERRLLRPVRHLSGVTALDDPDRLAVGTSGAGDLYTLKFQEDAVRRGQQHLDLPGHVGAFRVDDLAQDGGGDAGQGQGI